MMVRPHLLSNVFRRQNFQQQYDVIFSERHWGVGKGTLHKKNVYWEGGTPHILCWGGDTAQHLQKKRSGGWVGGGVSQSENNATLWLYLASWNLPDSQLS